MINKFGAAGGFDAILEVIESYREDDLDVAEDKKGDPGSYDIFEKYTQIIGQLYQTLYRPYAKKFLPKFCGAVLDILRTNPWLRTKQKINFNLAKTEIERLCIRYMSPCMKQAVMPTSPHFSASGLI